LKVAIFADSYLPTINGVVTQIRNISKELIRRGDEVVIVAPAQDSKFSEEKIEGAQVLYLPSIALPTYSEYRVMPPHSSRIISKIKNFKPDIVHVHTPFSAGWLGLQIGKKLKVPIVGTYHTLLPEFLMYLPIPFVKNSQWAKSVTWHYTNFFYNQCDVITTPTKTMKEELEKNGAKKNVVVLPNAIDFEMFNSAKKSKKSSKSTKMIYFGRISYEKNIEVLLLALRHILWKGKNVSLTITGSGPALEYLKNIARENKISKHVDFHPTLLQNELADHVASHDIFMTASTIETQGLTILEAMAAGVCCIGANHLAIPDSIKDGKNGLLFKPYDFLELAKKCEKLISEPKLRKKLAENAVQTARNYSSAIIATQTQDLYKSAVANFKSK